MRGHRVPSPDLDWLDPRNSARATCSSQGHCGQPLWVKLEVTCGNPLFSAYSHPMAACNSRLQLGRGSHACRYMYSYCFRSTCSVWCNFFFLCSMLFIFKSISFALLLFHFFRSSEHKREFLFSFRQPLVFTFIKITGTFPGRLGSERARRQYYNRSMSPLFFQWPESHLLQLSYILPSASMT